MRSWHSFILGAAIMAVLAGLAFGPGRKTFADPADAPAAAPSLEHLRAIQQKLDDIKLILVEVRAENEDLKARVHGLMEGLHVLGNGKAVKPEKPKVEPLPEELPELKPLPDK